MHNKSLLDSIAGTTPMRTGWLLESARDLMANKHTKQRPSLFNRVSLWMSASKRMDGLWIGTLATEPEAVLRRVETALCQIKTYDRLRYNRIIRDLERIWVMTLVNPVGNFDQAVNACM